MISAVILTKNNEKEIEKCLDSVSWCEEIIVIDDNSVSKYQISNIKYQNDNGKIKIYERKLDEDFSKQRNLGLEKAKGEWVLFVDADESIAPELQSEIKREIDQNNQVNGFYFKRKDRFMGKWLKYGETASTRLLRLARKNAGKWSGKVHEVWQIKGKTRELKHPLLHDRNLTISQFLERINYYSTIRAKELYQQKARSNWFWIIIYPLAKFIQNYFFRLGFLDGVQGLVMAVIMSFHSFLVRGKLYLSFHLGRVHSATPEVS